MILLYTCSGSAPIDEQRFVPPSSHFKTQPGLASTVSPPSAAFEWRRCERSATWHPRWRSPRTARRLLTPRGVNQHLIDAVRSYVVRLYTLCLRAPYKQREFGSDLTKDRATGMRRDKERDKAGSAALRIGLPGAPPMQRRKVHLQGRKQAGGGPGREEVGLDGWCAE
jgi:hypothetical protein